MAVSGRGASLRSDDDTPFLNKGRPGTCLADVSLRGPEIRAILKDVSDPLFYEIMNLRKKVEPYSLAG
jgi:hypothetical protein